MNRKNYQLETDRIIRSEEGRIPGLFLHVCCAPCSSYVLEYLSEYFEITVFYYNPNITDREEYAKRSSEVQRLISELQPKNPIHFLEGKYEPELFFECCREFAAEPEGGKRCEQCFRLRLSETASLARSGGFDYFTTTLTISPLKNADLLNRIGEEMAEKYGVSFLPSDFKKRGGYQRSIELSKIHGLYRQDYCGCVYSKEARRKDELKLTLSENCARTAVTVDLSRIRENVASILRNAGRSDGFVAVIKADGYGHGAIETAAAVSDLVWGFAVATPEEALSLRKHRITKPILVLGQVMESRMRDMIEQEIRIPVFEPERAKLLSDTALSLGKKALIHLKLDTGMRRIGLPVTEKGFSSAKEILSLPGLQAEGIFTHLATADMIENEPAFKQIDAFRSFCDRLSAEGYLIPLRHYANSAAAILFDCQDSALLRVGIALYGLYPSEECDYSAVHLKPALSWDAQITYVKTVPEGLPVSYGGTYVTAREMRIATVSVGYADGYPRSLSNTGEVLVLGKRCRILGRVCMDQMMIDVTEVDGVREGMRVTLLGKDGDEEITAEELGEKSGRFNYELVCDISKRVPRIFRREGKIVSVSEWFDD